MIFTRDRGYTGREISEGWVISYHPLPTGRAWSPMTRTCNMFGAQQRLS